MGNSYYNCGKSSKQAEINYCTYRINQIKAECEYLETAKRNLDTYIDEFEAVISKRITEIQGLYSNEIWSGKQKSHFKSDIADAGDISIVKLKQGMESNRDSLQIILNNKRSEYYELINEKYRLESEKNTIKLMADMIND